MQASQREHIATVLQVAQQGVAAAGAAHDELIHSSWLRCVHEHRLDPAQMQEAVILPQARIREHQDQMEDFLQIARFGLESLYQLYLGADWSERHAGTCGVGTCISPGQALTVHQGDHFDATHIPLTCSSSPIFGASGRLDAVLDISALTAPRDKHGQHMALQIVRMTTHQIENAWFLHRFRKEWVLRLSAAPQFIEVNPEYLLAIDGAGRVIGHNRRAQLLFAEAGIAPLLGHAFDGLLSIGLEHIGRFAPAPLAALSGGDPQLDRQIERAARLINSPISILLTGETGTGKEYFAKALHQGSERRNGPFVAVNCAAIPETLIESELFGYLPGSFSGASSKGKRGLIAEAHGGTLFLDEIGDMPRPLQARLSRVLAEKEVQPIGGRQPVAVNVRVIAATHCRLEELVRDGRLRDDPYYRLNGAQISLPALRERRDFGWVVALLRAHDWPGTCASCAT